MHRQYVPIGSHTFTSIKCDCYSCKHLLKPLLPHISPSAAGQILYVGLIHTGYLKVKAKVNNEEARENSKSIKIISRNRFTQVLSGTLFIPKYFWLNYIHQRKQWTVTASIPPSVLADLCKRLLVQRHA